VIVQQESEKSDNSFDAGFLAGFSGGFKEEKRKTRCPNLRFLFGDFRGFL